MSDRPTPNNLDERLTILLKSKLGTYVIRLLAGEARDEIRKLTRQRDAAVEALKAIEDHHNETEEWRDIARAVLREIEGKS